MTLINRRNFTKTTLLGGGIFLFPGCAIKSDNPLFLFFNDKEVKSFMEVSAFINSSSTNTIDIGILRNDNELNFNVKPKVIKSEDALGNKANKKIIGIDK